MEKFNLENLGESDLGQRNVGVDLKNEEVKDEKLTNEEVKVGQKIESGSSLRTSGKLELFEAGVNKKKVERIVKIYGVYNFAKDPIWERIKDFFVERKKIDLKDKAYFFHLLGVMIDSGVQVNEAVKILSNRSNNLRFERILSTVAYDLQKGNSFSQAVAKYPDVFGDLEKGVIKSGEAAGNLDKMLKRLSKELDQMNKVRGKVVNAMLYPATVFGFLVVATVVMLIFVLPFLFALLKDAGLQEEDFPLLTRLLVGLSDLLVGYWWVFSLGLVIGYLLFGVWVGTDRGRIRFDLQKLRVPVFGDLLKKLMVYRFISTFGILVESGVPILKALKIVSQSLSNKAYSIKIDQIAEGVSRGEKISDGMEREEEFFSPDVTKMFGVGEKTASIALVAKKIGEQYSLEINNSIKRLISVLEIVMILIIALVVLMMALAVLMPIFQLTVSV